VKPTPEISLGDVNVAIMLEVPERSNATEDKTESQPVVTPWPERYSEPDPALQEKSVPPTAVATVA
jgi:hypothetical protein